MSSNKRKQHGVRFLHFKISFSPDIIKILAMALAVIAQVAVVVLPSVFFRQYIAHINWILELISLVVVLYIIKSDINPVYKIPWIVILFILPIFGGIIYLIYGRAHFGKKEIIKTRSVVEATKEAIYSRPVYNEELKSEDLYAGIQAEYLKNRADAPAYKHTATQFFPLGDDMLPVMLQELEKARRFIFMEFFIIEEGKMLNPILEILERKAGQGLDVRFMYDSFGSMTKIHVGIIKRLQSKGIKVFEFNSFRTIIDSRYNNRDHRKICVIDGNVGFTGGINLADEYINQTVKFGHWKDTAIMVKGEAVWSLTTMFLSLWDTSTYATDDFGKYEPTEKFDYDNGYVVPYTDYPLDDEAVGKNVYLNIINRARRYVYIMTPYLIIDNVMVTALENAARNGIDVRIITPGIPDKKLAYMLTRSYYEVLIRQGVKIYEYTPGFVHAKIFVSDDETAVVGTINLDYRSLTHHFENAIWMYKTSAVADIKKDYMNTLDKCELYPLERCKKQSLLKRILLPILRLFSPLF